MFKLHTSFSPLGNPNCISAADDSEKKRIWILVFSKSIWVLLELIGRWTQHFTKIDQEKCKIEQICIWNPMTVPDLLCKHYLCHQNGISLIELQTFFLAKHCQQQGVRRNGSFRMLIPPINIIYLTTWNFSDSPATFKWLPGLCQQTFSRTKSFSKIQ